MSSSATAPEAPSFLHQRVLLAEEEAEALTRGMVALGVSRNQILGPGEIASSPRRPLSPMKTDLVPGHERTLWQECDTLVSRVSRLESLLQTLKLTVFRLETEQELDPTRAANLKQQQLENEEEQKVCWREVMKLREQLQQAYQERDDARTELQTVSGTVEAAIAAKMDLGLAAEELKTVKLEMNQKFMKMKEQMMQESTCSAEAMKSHSRLLQRVQEMEREVEMERRQGLRLYSDYRVLGVEVQSSRQQLEEEKERVRQLEEHCQQLREQTAVKESLISELKTEIKVNHNHLVKTEQKTQSATTADRSQLLKQLKEQDLLLKASRRTDLQMALTDSVCLQKELEKLKGEHAELLQSFSIAQETADNHKELLERVVERLQGELSMAQKQEEARRKDLEDSKHELRLVVTKLEAEKSRLETQLGKAKQEAASLSSALQAEQDETRRLLGKVASLEQHQQVEQMLKDKLPHEKRKLKMSEMETRGLHGPPGSGISLEDCTGFKLSSHVRHQEVQEQEVETLRNDRLKAHREIRKHRVEVEKLQQILTSSNSNNNKAIQSLQKALDTAKGDNNRLAHSLEQAVLTNCSLQSKLEQVRDQYQTTVSLRDEELHEAQSKISYLCEQLGTVQQQNGKDYESSMKRLQEISELKMTDGSPKTDHELQHQVSELENCVSNQEACFKVQRSQLRQQQKCRCSQDSSQKLERAKENIRNVHEKEKDDRKIQMIGGDSKQVSSRWEAEMERWTSTLQRWETKRDLGHKPGRTQLMTHSH
ncbi:hypothetical protein Q5P01_009849 [Channa striata]|uniref:Coiled-coil domain-containing protein 150 n=1 Tax=Channa striata TaxID=64152 RepID=A0AA88SSM6_CHASR|nr:hypothetical protein Q5P01_009849 [Channa striata]